MQATWIWYPGDFEIWLHKEVSLRRQERGNFYPPFWRLDLPYPRVRFRKRFELAQPEVIFLAADGRFAVTLDGRFSHNAQRVTLPAGAHTLELNVFNQETLPSVYAAGQTINSDSSWEVATDDVHWQKAGSWQFNSPSEKPSQYRLPTREVEPVAVERRGSGQLVDFGRETFGFLSFRGIKGRGKVAVYYGESLAEALAADECETTDELHLSGDAAVAPCSRAFRYVRLSPEAGVTWEKVACLYEFLPRKRRGKFKCSDPLLNQIWEVAAYTLELTAREFFLDGIKRDRWVWGGDAYQAALMNYYLFFDPDVVKRTLIALRGKDPVRMHVNHIMDYTFYWFLTLYDYYLYTGDLDFVRSIYPRALGLMEFCRKRCDPATGFINSVPEDWIFIDWADIDNKGLVSAEEILFARSLEVLSELAGRLSDGRGEEFGRRAEQLKAKIFDLFWDEERGGFIHNISPSSQRKLTRYPNIFAALFGMLSPERQKQVTQVLLDPEIQAITTPYMKFFELAALCESGKQAMVLDHIRSYWGGMLNLGATAFWEYYDPAQQGAEHYAMYGRPFGKSLCHAWGASPVYLLGKYFLGVRPLSPGFGRFIVEPQLGDLAWLKGVVPLPAGEVKVYLAHDTLEIETTQQGGTLRFCSAAEPFCSEGRPVLVAGNMYELPLLANQAYKITLAVI